MGFKLKEDKFDVLLGKIVKNLSEASNYFAEYKLKNVSDLKIFTQQMKEYEHKGDLLTHEINRELNKAFITPIEREDILSLSMALDDVLDGLEHCAALFEIYSIWRADDFMCQLVENIRLCVIEIEKAVSLLSTKKLSKISEHAIKMKEYESICDTIHRESIKKLFEKETNPLKIIQYKEIYESLETIADFCQIVANTLDTLIMRNA